MRQRQKRNLLATLFFSLGVPMLLAGDEMGRTQRGNNNAYCQDSELSWLDWALDAEARALLEFTRQAIALRKQFPEFRRRAYTKDITWLTPQGGAMTEADWHLPFARCLGAQMDGLLLLLNAHHEPIDFVLPGEGWTPLLDTSEQQHPIEKSYPLQGRSLALLRRGAA